MKKLKFKNIKKRKGVVFNPRKTTKDTIVNSPIANAIVDSNPTFIKNNKSKEDDLIKGFNEFSGTYSMMKIKQGGVDKDIISYNPKKHSQQYLVRKTGTDSRASLRLMFWNLEHSGCGVDNKRLQGGKRIEKLFDQLDNNGISYDTLRDLSGPERIKLFARLNIQPSERIWLTALLRNKPCGHTIFSEDGKHVCLRHGTADGKCSIHLSNQNDLQCPPDGATRSEIRSFYGKSIYPIYEIFDEFPMQERFMKMNGPNAHIDEAVQGAVQLSEMMNDIKESKGIEGDLPQDDTDSAYSCWSYGIDDSPEDMVSIHNARSFQQLSSPLRNYVVELLQVDFDKGAPGDYQKKVLRRREEWAKYFTKLTRKLHEGIEPAAITKPQSMKPPTIEQLQYGVDGGDTIIKETLTPPGQDDDVLFRPADPSRAVTQSDVPTLMPSIIIKGTISLADSSRKTNTYSSSIQLSLDVLFHSNVCFNNNRQLRDTIRRNLTGLPLPPAMIPFTALVRVDPLDYILFLEEQKRNSPSQNLPLLHA